MTNHQRILLVDADVPLYKAAFASEVETDWGDDLWTLHSNIGTAKDIFTQEIGAIRDEFTDDDLVLLCFTGGANFRKHLLPTYKSNRKKTRKPLVLKALKAWAMETYDSELVEGLEADDLLGLLSSNPTQSIMVSIDKDMKTVPGLHYNPNFPEDGVYIVTPEEAHYNHMYQTLCGDSTDGYSGCPGVGPVAAKRVLNVPTENMWPAVVHAFSQRDLTPEDALVQARVARILRGGEYDWGTNEAALWSPTDA
ncbi:MAG: exonuclease [Gammaproteobacteria bacterium]|nr:exonuclease [Gammaproteobacteria bacterium]